MVFIFFFPILHNIQLEKGNYIFSTTEDSVFLNHFLFQIKVHFAHQMQLHTQLLEEDLLTKSSICSDIAAVPTYRIKHIQLQILAGLQREPRQKTCGSCKNSPNWHQRSQPDARQEHDAGQPTPAARIGAPAVLRSWGSLSGYQRTGSCMSGGGNWFWMHEGSVVWPLFNLFGEGAKVPVMWGSYLVLWFVLGTTEWFYYGFGLGVVHDSALWVLCAARQGFDQRIGIVYFTGQVEWIIHRKN